MFVHGLTIEKLERSSTSFLSDLFCLFYRESLLVAKMQRREQVIISRKLQNAKIRVRRAVVRQSLVSALGFAKKEIFCVPYCDDTNGRKEGFST